MCSVIHCGFPMASEMALAFPSILGGKNTLKNAEIIKTQDLIKWMEGT